MKRFYIAERFSFDLDPETEDNQIVDDDLTKISGKYNYFPKTKKELRELVDRLIEERGNEADLNDIYTGYVTDMSRLFANRKHFNGDVSGWDVSNVRSMYCMFSQCYDFNQDISRWDVSNVENMSSMFRFCKKFNQPIGVWDVSNVNDMGQMFFDCMHFIQDLSGWDMSRVRNTTKMFCCCWGLLRRDCEEFQQTLQAWGIKKGTAEYFNLFIQ